MKMSPIITIDDIPLASFAWCDPDLLRDVTSVSSSVVVLSDEEGWSFEKLYGSTSRPVASVDEGRALLGELITILMRRKDFARFTCWTRTRWSGRTIPLTKTPGDDKVLSVK